MKTILLLEDNDDRIAAFRRAVAQLGDGIELKLWRDAPSMIAECERFFPTTVLISLDHDLNPAPDATTDPGTGLDVARYLGDFIPVCPVLIHSSNTERVYSMHNELRFAGWVVDRVGPLGSDWIETSWLRSARGLLAEHGNTWKASLPPDHSSRVERMKLSLTGLGLGDALGEMLSYQAQLAPATWRIMIYLPDRGFIPTIPKWRFPSSLSCNPTVTSIKTPWPSVSPAVSNAIPIEAMAK